MNFQINTRNIDPTHPPFVIAEIGINHNGEFWKAKKMIDDAYASGAECVKFQTHVISGQYGEMLQNNVVPPNAKESIYDMMVRCSLSEEQDAELKTYTESKGLIYLSTPFSRAAVDRLERLGVLAYKIGSGECNNYPLIEYICKTGKPIILSTGMNNIASVKKAVQIIERYNVPYALLHCTSMYPTPYNKVRLGGIEDLRCNFPTAVLGLSDHSLGNYTSYAAVALGASIIEKHFTSSQNWHGSDIEISITPSQLQELIDGCNAIHQAMGGSKTILPEEKGVIDFAYACVVSTKPIKAGEPFTEDNIWVKRPGTGEITAEHYNQMLTKVALRDIEPDRQIRIADVKDFESIEIKLSLENNYIDDVLNRFVNNHELEVYKKLYKDLRNTYEEERTKYLVLNGFNAKSFEIHRNLHPSFFEIEEKWKKRLQLLDEPYLKLAKYKTGDVLQFNHSYNSIKVVEAMVKDVFLSHSGSGEICYNFLLETCSPPVPEINPYCMEKNVIKKIK